MVTPIKFLLEHANAEYVDKLYTCGPPPDFDRQDWLKEKFSLGLDFPNLPYLIDGDVKLSQNQAIMRYLARKYGFEAKSEADKQRVDMAAAQVYDYQMDYARTIAYNPNFKDNEEAYHKGMVDKMEAMAKFIGERQFIAGDYVTFVDFIFFEFLEGQLYYNPEVLKDQPKLAEYHQRVRKLAGVEKYFNSQRAITYPFNGFPAYIGGPYSEQMLKTLEK